LTIELELQALLTIKEGYKAENDYRIMMGTNLAYTYKEFEALANEIRGLQDKRDIVKMLKSVDGSAMEKE
jgi:hypothetical protein